MGSHGLLVVPEQTFLIDEQGNMWNLLDRRTAYERMEKSSEFARVAKKAGRGTAFGATGGALVGAAIGILSGQNVGDAALKGAALGGAGGAVIGGAQELGSEESARQISSDLANKELENKMIQPGDLGRGFPLLPRGSFFGGDLAAATEGGWERSGTHPDLLLAVKDESSSQACWRFQG
jgi:hypothetical protein